MKQLKCLVTDYSVVDNNGLIDINFQESINIGANSRISLDKISLEILPNPEGVINLTADQTINITTQLSGDRTVASRQITLPSGKYTYNASTSPQYKGIPDLLLTLNNLCNGILNGTPLQSNAVTSKETDYGLSFKWLGKHSKNSYKLSLHVLQSAFGEGNKGFAPILNNNEMTDDNMSQSSQAKTSGFVANKLGAFYAYTNLPIINGCFNTSINCKIREENGVIDPVDIGLCLNPGIRTTPTILYGIAVRNNKIYILNNGELGAELDKSKIVNKDSLKLWFYTDSTTGNFRIGRQEEGTSPFEELSAVGVFNGFDFNTSYCHGISGTSTHEIIDKSHQFLNWRAFLQPNVVVNDYGVVYNTEPEQNLIYLSKENLEAGTPNRIIQLDFHSAPLLINSLGFNTNIIQGNVSDTTIFVRNANAGIDFQNYYDIGLDVLNLDLSTYVGSSGTSASTDTSQVYYKQRISGKKNTLAYFIIQRLQPDESIFFSESKQLIFLDIENKEPMSISSLQFRLYNVDSQIPVNFSTASFNLYVD